MRLLENGPEIPELLMTAREEGRVVFFCGAGVSVPAGYPNFLDLTLKVMRRLGVSARVDNQLFAYLAMIEGSIGASKKQKLPFSFDQVFYLLQQEYGAAAVEREVSSALKEKKAPFVDYHKVVLRLSRNASQTPQVVTTNFDLLFERAQKGISVHVQPALPDLNVGVAPEGVIYLHGRLDAKSRAGGQSNLIISSADFGRAYLADGWANRFIKALASQYIIVLLGYSAEDPPVKYLLEGLHAKKAETTGSIFAFERGTQESVEQNWRHRGVTGIAYTNYDDLWGSLAAWADYADNPDAWQSNVLKLAQRSPRDLSPFQRGQVAHLVSSALGAEGFYNADPSPSAEWLCVFDPYVRNMEEKFIRRYPESLSYNFSPREIYGLEDDPVLDYKNHDNQYWGVNYLSAISEDKYVLTRDKASLAGVAHKELPTRLRFISAWIAKNMHDPWALWWAAGKSNLHQHLLRLLEHRLGSKDQAILSQAVNEWGILVAENERKPNLDFSLEWYQFKELVSARGWCFLAFQYLERAIKPRLKIKRGSGLPMTEIRDGSGVVELELELVSLHGEAFNVPSEHLVEVVLLWRESICRASKLAMELSYFAAPDIFEKKEAFVNEEVFEFVATFSDLYTALAIADPQKAKSEFLSWPKAEPYFFPQLKVFALNCPGLFGSSEVSTYIQAFSDEEFWQERCRRKIIFLLVKYWDGFTVSERAQLEDRVIEGPASDDRTAVYQPSNGRYAIIEMLLGLREGGCSLSKMSLDKLDKLKALEDLADEVGSSSFRKKIRRSGWVKTDKDVSLLVSCALKDVVKVALKGEPRNINDFVEKRPFKGLVEERPLRALKSLVLEAKQYSYPTALWQDLLTEWPSNDARLTAHVAQRLIALPPVEVAKISHAYSQWMEDNLKVVFDLRAELGLLIWDSAINLLLKSGDVALASAYDSPTSSSRVPSRTIQTLERSRASPMGRMTEALFAMMNYGGLKRGKGMQSDLKIRLNRLLSLESTCLRYIVGVISFRLGWLFWVEPTWTKEKLLPLFSMDSELAEVAWDGRLYDNRHFSSALFAELKPQFIDLFSRLTEWKWGRERSRILHQHLVLACRYGMRKGSGVNFQEVREVLQTTDDAGRVDVLRYLSTLFKSTSDWKKFGKAFLERAWPRELRYLSSDTTRCFINIADKTPGCFPDVVKVILPLLTVMARCDSLFFYSHNNSEVPLTTLYPEQMLALLDKVLADNSVPPYEFVKMLNQIIVAEPLLAKDKRYLRLRKISIENVWF